MPESQDYISEDSFMDDYEPIDQSRDGDMIIQTYNDALLAAQASNVGTNHIWAIVEGDDDGSLYASPGYHLVNTIGFVVTRNPWIDESKDAVWHDASEDMDEDCSDSLAGPR